MEKVQIMGTDEEVTEETTKLEKLVEAAGTSIDKDDHLWRPITNDVTRDLSLVKQQRMQKLAVFLWESNLLADRLIELPLAFILGDGIKLTVPDEKYQEVLNCFWSDPVNRMDLTLEEKLRELGLFGEQCYPAFVNEIDGHVRTGYLDPSLIETVVQDPDNAQIPIGVVTTKNKGVARRFRIIMNADEDVFTERTQEIRKTFTDGDVFYFRIRGLSNGSRGRSDLLPQMDWLDAYDQFMFGELDRNDSLRAFIWDVLVKGASQDEIDEKAKNIQVPDSGGVRVHNENEEWAAVAPELNSADTAAGARLFRNHILGGATIPEHWFGGGGDVNRSTAGEMDEPTFKILGMRQRRLRYMLEFIGTFVVRQAALANKETVGKDHVAYQVVCEVPDMVQRDTTKYAAALQQVVVAMVAAINGKLVTREFAIKMVTQTAKRLGIECEAEDLIKDLEKERTDDEEDDLPDEDVVEAV